MKNKVTNTTNAIITGGSYLAASNVVNALNQAINNNFSIEQIPYYIQNGITSFSTYTNMLNVSNPINIIGLGAVGYVGYQLFASKKNKGYEQRDDYGSHGTSRFQTPQEIQRRYYKDNVGWFLGTVDMETTYDKDNKLKIPRKSINPYTYVPGMKGAYHPINGELNMQSIIIGPPGSQKTTGYVLPNIFNIVEMYKDKEEKADIIITDPKSELFEHTSSYLKDNGYEVKVLDFLNLRYGDTFNPLDYIHDEKMLIEICDAFCKSTSSSETEDFWESQKVQLLVAVIGYVLQKNSEDKRTFAEALSLLSQINTLSSDELPEVFKKNGVTGAPKQMWDNFCSVARSANTRAGIMGTLTASMKLFSIEGIRNLTSSTSVPIEKLGAKKDKPIAVFILMPDEDRSFGAIISVILSVLFKQLYKTAHKTNNRLEWPVYFMLEEFCSIDPIKNIAPLLATMRGRRIYPTLIIQSISQLKDRYKYSWENIVSQCDTMVVLGVNDKFTAEYVSEMLGTTTIKISSSSNSQQRNSMSQSESQMYQSRRLMLADEVLKLDNKKLIVRQRANNPAILYKVQYKYWENRLCPPSPVHDLREIKKVPAPVVEELILDTNKEMEVKDINTDKEVDAFSMDESLGAVETESKFEL